MLGYKPPTTTNQAGAWRNRKCKNLAALSTDSQLSFPRAEVLDLTSRGQGNRGDDMLHVILDEGMGQLMMERKCRLALLGNEAADRFAEVAPYLGLNSEKVPTAEFTKIREAVRDVCIKCNICMDQEDLHRLAMRLGLVVEKPWEEARRQREEEDAARIRMLEEREAAVKERERHQRADTGTEEESEDSDDEIADLQRQLQDRRQLQTQQSKSPERGGEGPCQGSEEASPAETT